MKTIENLIAGDYIAFAYQYSSEPKSIMVARITSVRENEFLVHFSYGHHSIGEYIPKNEVIAIGDNEATGKISGFGGKYNILLPDNEILLKNNSAPNYIE